jgi:uncharacterized protein (DUF1919 family)
MFLLTNKEYNNPFIGSLFINDSDYVKLCSNLNYYLNLIPIFKKSLKNSKWYKQGNDIYKIMGMYPIYPIMFLDDIEIHWIHEKNEEDTIQKYNRRIKRYINLNNPINLCILSFSELLNDHSKDDLDKLLNLFFDINENVIFIGPNYLLTNNIKNKLSKNKHYIIKEEWNNILLNRNDSFVYHFNNQPQLRNDIINYIHSTNAYESL